LAETNPEKFYKKVFDQEIVKHKVAEDKKKKQKNVDRAQKKTEKKGSEVKPKKAPLTITSKVTKRPFNKVMEKLRMKIREKLQLRLAGLGGEAAHPDMGDLIMGAFDDTKVKGKLNNLLKEKKIQLVDQETGEVKYEEQIEKAINLQLDDPEEDDEMYSPERKTRTKIAMQETDMVQLENEIKGAIERQKTARPDDEEEKEEFNGHVVAESKEKRPKSGKKGKNSSAKK